MKRHLNRGISILLSVCMVLSILAGSGVSLVRAESATKTETVVSFPNLIANGTFGEVRKVSTYENVLAEELGCSYEDKTNMKVELTDAYQVNGQYYACDGYALHVDYSGSKNEFIYKEVELPAYTAGTSKIKLSASACGTFQTDTGVKTAYISIVFYDEAGDTVGDEKKVWFKTTEAWQEYNSNVTIPDGAASVRANIYAAYKNRLSNGYVDNVSLTVDGGEDLLAKAGVNSSFNDIPDETKLVVTEQLCMDKSGWTETASSTIIANDEGDNAYLQLAGDAAKHAWGAVNSIDVEPDTKYQLTFDYKSDADVGFCVGTDEALHSDLLAAETWTTVSAITFTTGSEQESLDIYPYFAAVENGVGVRNAWFDNFVLAKVCNHVWGEATETGAGNCQSPLVSTAKCACGAVQTTTTTYDHTYVGDTCSACGAVCVHNAPEGYCVNCGLELPAHTIEKEELFSNGALQSTDANGTVQFSYNGYKDTTKTSGWVSPKEMSDIAEGTKAYAAFDWEEGNETNAVLHVYDDDNTKATAIQYYQFKLEKGTEYTLKFDAKSSGTEHPTVYVRKPDGTDLRKITPSADDWKTYEDTFTTPTEDYTHIVIRIGTGKGVTGYDALFDNFSLTGECIHTWGNPVVSEADCRTGAVRTVTCSDCGAIGTTVVSEPDEHLWDDGVIDPDLSNSEDMVTIYTCTVCSATKSVTTHANGHRYDAVVTAPTCDTDGYTTYTCRCGDSYKDDYIAATGHSYENGKCTVCNENHEFKLLLLGNSYSRDAANWGQSMTTSMLFDILQAMLGEHAEITLGLVHQGSRAMNWHATQAYHNNPAYSFAVITTANPKWKAVSSSYTSAEALAYADWDAVSLQPYMYDGATGQEKLLYPKETDSQFYFLKDAAAYMLDHVAKYAPTAEVYLYTHWVGASETVLNASLAKYEKEAAYWPAVLEYAGTESGTKFKTLIPVNLSIQNARTTYLATLRYNTHLTDYTLVNDVQVGLQRDSGHLSLNVGRYIASLTFAETIISADMRAEGYVLPDIRITESVGKLPKEYTEIAQKAVLAAVNSWKNGSLAVTNIEGYEQDPTVAATETLNAMTLTVCGNADYSEQIRAAVLAALPADFAVDAVTVNTDTNTASVTIRFGYTSATVEMEMEYAHSYNKVVTNPTCTEAGYTTYTCSVCDHSYTADNVDALGHTYVDGECSVCGEADPNAPTGPIADANLTFLGGAAISFQDYIGMNIMFYNGTAANYDKFYAVATQVDPDGNAVETLCNVVPYSYGGYDYTIFEHPVMSWSMTEQVTLTLYAEKDGVVYVGQSITTSVQALALEKLATYAAANNTVNCAALVDMLNYGAAVQVNQNHFVESLPSAGDYASYGTTTTPEFNATTSVTGDGIVGYGPSISMQAKVEFNVMYYGADLEGKTVKAFVDGEEVEVLYNYDAAPGWPIARVVIKASQMRSTFTIAVYDANGNVVSQVIEASIEACAKSHIGGANNDLVIALMRYGDSVSKVG